MADEAKRQDVLVVSALAQAGVKCRSIYDLLERKTPYPGAISVLIGLLPIVTDYSIKEGIARALGTREARGRAEEPLVREFLALPISEASSRLKWAIGNALNSLDRRQVADDLLSIAANPTHGYSRQMIVYGLGVIKDVRVVPLLIELLRDESVRGHAIHALRAIKAKEAVPALRLLVDDDNRWIKKSARAAVLSLSTPKTS